MCSFSVVGLWFEPVLSSARPRQAERACAFEKLIPNPTTALTGFPSLGFLVSFAFFICVPHLIEGDPLAI